MPGITSFIFGGFFGEKVAIEEIQCRIFPTSLAEIRGFNILVDAAPSMAFVPLAVHSRISAQAGHCSDPIVIL
jgi:hypothetical protein